MNREHICAIGIEKGNFPIWPGKTDADRKTKRIYPTTIVTPVTKYPTPDPGRKPGKNPALIKGEDKDDSIDEYA